MPPVSRKGWCPYCQTEIALPEHSGPVVVCSNCARTIAVQAAPDVRRRSRSTSSKIWGTIAGVLALALVILGYRHRGHLSSAFGYLTDATGGRTIAILSLIAAFFLLACFVFWLVFPILVYLGLRDVRRRTARLDQTLELCGQQLVWLTGQRDAAKLDPPPPSGQGADIPH